MHVFNIEMVNQNWNDFLFIYRINLYYLLRLASEARWEAGVLNSQKECICLANSLMIYQLI